MFKYKVMKVIILYKSEFIELRFCWQENCNYNKRLDKKTLSWCGISVPMKYCQTLPGCSAVEVTIH